MKMHALLMATAGIAVAVSAQDIGISATSTPVPLVANAGTVVVTDQLDLAQAAVGQYASAIALDVPALSLAGATWGVVRDFQRVRTCGYSIRGLTTSGGSGSATIGLHDVVIELTSPVPRFVSLTWTVGATATGGALPLFELDMMDDGVLDDSGSLPFVQLGPQPVRIRIRAQGVTASAAGQGSRFDARFELDILPKNDVAVVTATHGCGPQAFVHPSFAGGGIEILSPGSQLAVFWFGAQPVLLPNSSQSAFPCLLYPQPDVVVVLPDTGLLMPIPDAARPASFFVQAISVYAALDLRTSDAFFVTAN